jgi:hypothetical protein
MSWIAPVMGGVLGGGASLAGGCMGSDAAGNAARAQARAANYATRMQVRMFNRANKLLQPWRAKGAWALQALQNRLREGPMGPWAYKKSPDYTFRLREGMNALESDAAMRGMLESGPTLKALTKYAQDFATGDYQNYLNRFYQKLNPYMSLAGLGQTSAQSSANTGANYAAMIGNNISQAGQARASGYINQANAMGGALGGISNNLLMMPFLYQYMNRGQNPIGSSGYPIGSNDFYDWMYSSGGY